jgi:hypothetical protein
MKKMTKTEAKKTLKPYKSVTVNDDMTFTVRMPNGKTKTYKTISGAIACAEKTAVKIEVPYIVTTNTYFWTPQGSASGRRSAEKRRNAELEQFSDQFEKVPTVYVDGSYSESCKNVYKSVVYKVRRDGEWLSTNLTGFIGECAKWGITLLK